MFEVDPSTGDNQLAIDAPDLNLWWVQRSAYDQSSDTWFVGDLMHSKYVVFSPTTAQLLTSGTMPDGVGVWGAAYGRCLSRPATHSTACEATEGSAASSTSSPRDSSRRSEWRRNRDQSAS